MHRYKQQQQQVCKQKAGIDPLCGGTGCLDVCKQQQEGKGGEMGSL